MSQLNPPQPAADVVIAGSGIAGLSAAIFAASAGLSAIILEKSDLVGGSTSRSYGGWWVANNDDARARGLHDDRASALRYLSFLSAGQADDARVEAFIDTAPRALAMLTRAGVRGRLTKVGDHFYGRADGSLPHGRTFEIEPVPGARLGGWRGRLRTPKGDGWRIPLVDLVRMTADEAAAALAAAQADDQLAQGAALVAQALAAALDMGVDVRLRVGASRLIEAGGRVVGVIGDDGRRFEARAGVVLACGGLESNVALTERIESLPGYMSDYIPEIQGDGLALAGDVGGALKIVGNNAAVFMAYEDPASGEPVVVANRQLGAPHALVVNRAGERFGNEASFQSLAGSLRHMDAAARRHRNLPCWLIFDARFARETGLGPPGAASVPDWVVRRGALDELARAMSIDPAGLLATVARFGDFAAKGRDLDHARGENGWGLAPAHGKGLNPSLGAVAEPPFYAVPLRPTIIGASGLQADSLARVLDWRGRPIPGLFAVGNAAAHDEYGAGYQAGQSIASAFTFALLAVETMAAQSGLAAPLARAAQ